MFRENKELSDKIKEIHQAFEEWDNSNKVPHGKKVEEIKESLQILNMLRAKLLKEPESCIKCEIETEEDREVRLINEKQAAQY